MKLNMITPKNKTEDSLLSINKNCETLIQQTHTKPQETIEFKTIKPKETFRFSPPFQIKGDWMIGLTSLEIYNSIYINPERNNKFEIYRDSSNKFGFLEIKDELEEILYISHISQEHLQDEILGPRIFDEFLKLSHENKKSGGYLILLLGCTRSPFRDFESYLRNVIGLDEKDIQLFFKQYYSFFITFELTPGIYTVQEPSHAVHIFSGHSEIIKIE